MAWLDLQAELEAEFRRFSHRDDVLAERLSDLLMRIRDYKATWQRDKWLAHREPSSVSKSRPRRALTGGRPRVSGGKKSIKSSYNSSEKSTGLSYIRAPKPPAPAPSFRRPCGRCKARARHGSCYAGACAPAPAHQPT
jgi:hypothetical protein